MTQPPDQTPVALQAVFACLRFSFDRDTDRLRDTCRQIKNWHAFLSWTRRHRVIPMVYQNLRQAAWDIVPDETQSFLEGAYRHNSFRSLALASETVRLIRLLAQQDIASIPLKGQMLALQVYGDLSGRDAGDIDLLIGPEDIDRADNVLQRHGYRLSMPEIVGTPLRKQFVLQRLHHHHYFSVASRLPVEIHWCLSSAFRLPLQFDWLWTQGERLSFSGTILTVLADLSNMVFLSTHGATHGWCQLKWLCDIAHIQSGYNETDWQRLLAVADRLNATRPVIQASVLAHTLLGSPMPDLVMAEVSKEPAISQLLKPALDRVRSSDPLPQTVLEKCSFHFYRANLRNTLRHKVMVLLRLTFHTGDWGTVRLPDSLFILNYPIRLLLWIQRQIQKKW